MGGNPPDNENLENSPEPVQDYLDLLLTQATEKPEAQIDLPAENPSVETSSTEQLLGNNQANVSSSNVALFSSHSNARSFS